MRLYSYVVARDFGFAPNPFYGVCTLATCKPRIRKTAGVGDWVIGTGSKRHQLAGKLVFVMRVTETMTFDEYWRDKRFAGKRPTMNGSFKQSFGDNIYHRDGKTHQWIQENSHHSFHDGSANFENVANDTQPNRVLVSTDYIYWGGTGPTIPERLRDFGGQDICMSAQGHKCRFAPELVERFLAWVNALGEDGYVGKPQNWM